MGCWYDETFDERVRYGLKVERLLHRERSDYQTIEVLETAQWGRVLVLDGIFNTSEGDERLYHEMLVHPAMALAKSIQDVVVVGGGDGGTVREVLRHADVRRCTLVEIDPRVVEVSKQFLPQHGNAWDDPRLSVAFADGAGWVRDAPARSVDVIIVDGTDPIGAGAVLFEEDFYRECARCLRAGGVLTTQSESPLLMPDAFVRIQRSLRSVFDSVHPCFGPVPIYAAGLWSYTVAGPGVEPGDFDEGRVAAIEADLHFYGGSLHRGAFVLPAFVRRLLEGSSGDQ